MTGTVPVCPRVSGWGIIDMGVTPCNAATLAKSMVVSKAVRSYAHSLM